MLYTFNYMVKSKNGACSTHCFFEIPILIRFLALNKKLAAIREVT